MSDTQAAMREFRFLDDKRKQGGLAPIEEQRWLELRAHLGFAEAAVPANTEAAPAGYYGEDGQWYAYPDASAYDPAAYGEGGYPDAGYGDSNGYGVTGDP